MNIIFNLGLIIFYVGAIMTLIINRNVKVNMNDDFWDMPTRIKIGIILSILGILIICASIMFMLINNPVGLLHKE